MPKSIDTVKTWGRKAFRTLQAFEAAVEYRYQDYAQERFDRLERRVAALEARIPVNPRRVIP